MKEDNVLSLDQSAVRNATAPENGARVTPVSDPLTSEQLLAHILTSLSDDKAEDIVQVDLRGKSELADYMVICSGRSSRQGGRDQ